MACAENYIVGMSVNTMCCRMICCKQLKIIAERQVNTLIIVDRVSLLEQWRERLSVFLNISKNEIGVIGGGKKKPTGNIDVAVSQSLYRDNKVSDLVKGYGQIICDECHHVSAVGFEQIMKNSPAKYKYGLTATLKRKDGKERIVLMQLGPVRYKDLSKVTSELEHKVLVQETGIGMDDSKSEYSTNAIFKIPFINVVDKVFAKVRNLTYRYMPNQLTLFPIETEQYNSWLIRELLNNCIAHTNYQLGGRIYVNEFEDKIKFTNPGDFIPQRIENVLEVSYNPPFYRNQLLAESMVAFHMIDTATLGIRRAYNIQKAKYFPMPDYDVASGTQVEVTVYGKILNDNYMHILYDHPELDLHTVFLLDRVQKGLPMQKEDVDKLRSLKLVEGRITSLYLSASAAKSISDGAGYIKNKGFDDKYYKDLIVEYLKQYEKAKKSEIRELLWDKLPDVLSDKQKENKIRNLLYSLKQKKIIETDSTNQQKSNWVLRK